MMILPTALAAMIVRAVAAARLLVDAFADARQMQREAGRRFSRIGD